MFSKWKTISSYCRFLSFNNKILFKFRLKVSCPCPACLNSPTKAPITITNNSKTDSSKDSSSTISTPHVYHSQNITRPPPESLLIMIMLSVKCKDVAVAICLVWFIRSQFASSSSGVTRTKVKIMMEDIETTMLLFYSTFWRSLLSSIFSGLCSSRFLDRLYSNKRNIVPLIRQTAAFRI